MVKICTWPDGCENMCEGRTDFCATHNHMMRKAEKDSMKVKKVYYLPKPTKPIAKVGQKMAKKLSVYNKMKGPWIKGKRCAVFNYVPAQDIHHMKGREGYADKWARENGIPLLIDKRFWLPVSRLGHIEIGDKDEWARKMGFTLSRVENISD